MNVDTNTNYVKKQLRTFQYDGATKQSFWEDFLDLIDDFGKLLEDEILTDVTLIVNGREIKAHKSILTARSPVFRAMFNNSLTEQLENRIVIEDINYDVIKEMLHFMYTTRASTNIANLADGLLIAAEKYDVPNLKRRCETMLTASLCVENAVDRLILAETYNATDLEVSTMQFIDKHYHEVCLTEGFHKIGIRLVKKLYDFSKNAPPKATLKRKLP